MSQENRNEGASCRYSSMFAGLNGSIDGPHRGRVLRPDWCLTLKRLDDAVAVGNVETWVWNATRNGLVAAVFVRDEACETLQDLFRIRSARQGALDARRLDVCGVLFRLESQLIYLGYICVLHMGLAVRSLRPGFFVCLCHLTLHLCTDERGCTVTVVARLFFP